MSLYQGFSVPKVHHPTNVSKVDQLQAELSEMTLRHDAKAAHTSFSSESDVAEAADRVKEEVRKEECSNKNRRTEEQKMHSCRLEQ